MKLGKLLRQDSLAAAPQLLGWVLCRQLPEGLVKLRIVETEAYHQDDPASHSFRGLTKRTAPMFEAGGHIYVYFTYGMHYALNIVSGPVGVGEGVLIRAGEPLAGIEIMKQNRNITDVKNLANGPGKLAQALGIKSTELSGSKLLNVLSNLDLIPVSPPGIYLEPPITPIKAADIVTGPRVGIRHATDLPARFYIQNNPFVSKV